jgi:hypothetical protein
VAGHQHEVALGGQRHELVHLRALHRRRLLDEHVLARLERLLRERIVSRNRRRDHDGFELGVGEQLPEVRRHTGAGVARGELVAQALVEVTEPGEVREGFEVAGQVRAPVAEPDEPDLDARHSFQTFSLVRPRSPVAFRKSTITGPLSTSAS